ncbi:bfpM [Pluralibacter gergoviae]|nr:bfpM [Pluralibacter gergoviae]
MSDDAEFAVAVALPVPSYLNGGADIWLKVSLVSEAIAIALSIHYQRKPALAKSL